MVRKLGAISKLTSDYPKCHPLRHVTISANVTGMRMTCKNPDCGRAFRPERAGAQYCSGACRVAAHRKRQAPLPVVVWIGDVPGFRAEKAELGSCLLEIAERDDDGKPKTGRRYYYLALSHGYISPDMSDTEAGQEVARGGLQEDQ
jgi:hypothetical protein